MELDRAVIWSNKKETPYAIASISAAVPPLPNRSSIQKYLTDKKTSHCRTLQ